MWLIEVDLFGISLFQHLHQSLAAHGVTTLQDFSRLTCATLSAIGVQDIEQRAKILTAVELLSDDEVEDEGEWARQLCEKKVCIQNKNGYLPMKLFEMIWVIFTQIIINLVEIRKYEVECNRTSKCLCIRIILFWHLWWLAIRKVMLFFEEVPMNCLRIYPR